MSECKHEIKELIDDGGNCKKCGEWYSLLFWYRSQQARIADLENQLASGIHTCNDHCPRPMCVARRRIRELEALQLTIYNAGYEKGNFDAVEGHYAPPIEYPEEFPEILEELEGEV